MPYLGASPQVGLVTKLNDINSGFNGVTTTFQLAIPPGGVTNYFTPGSVYALFVRLGGVTQNPGVDYTVSGSQITFTTAPAAGLSCFIIAIGQAINTGTPADGSVTDSKFGTITTVPTINIKNPSSASNNIVLDAAGGVTFQQIKGGALTLATAVASTSGTSIDFTGIPSWVKRVTVMLSGVSTSGTSQLLVQIGAGSVTTSGYIGQTNAIGAVVTAMSAGFIISNNVVAANTHQGAASLNLVGSNTWVEFGLISPQTASNYMSVGSGYITLAGTLDRIRLTTVNGSDTFDAGSVNILYE